MGLTIEKEYVVLISIVDIGGEGTKKEVLDNIYTKRYLNLGAEDLKEKENRKELKWRNDLAFTRKHLQVKGYIDDEIKNNWKITSQGKQYLYKICNSICQEGYDVKKITQQAMVRADKYLTYSMEEKNYEINENLLEYGTSLDEFPEGKEKERLHKYKERNPKVITEAKNRFKQKAGKLYCEVCGFNFEEVYGEIGTDYIEGHHTKPISELQEGDVTNINDIVLVCANCHRMLHKKRPCLSKEELVKILVK